MHSQDSLNECARYVLQVYVGALSVHYEALSVEASKQTTAEEIVQCIAERLGLTGNNYELAEVIGHCKERRLSPHEKPVSLKLLWPKHSDPHFGRFYLREKQSQEPTWYGFDPQVLKEFLSQPENREYPDLCQLPDLNESTLLENLRQRFEAGHIYTYVGSILIAVNPFRFLPIYNPKYVRLYQNQRIGPILPPHIFAIADNAYYCMLKEKRNQCVVISGESGSGKTESTNFLLHHLTALSQKGLHGSGVEQTILSAGPVLEAFGNAKTAHNNNSSRFGKFIQVNYRENGMVQGAVVQKYLLEKSRIVSQGTYERNYHVFYYLLSGATENEREALHLLPSDKYNYLNAKNLTLENCDEKYEFSRLKQSMEMVGFSPEKQRRLFMVLSAVLLLGNVEFHPKKSAYHHDESVHVKNLDVVHLISELLKVKYETLLAAVTSKRVKASDETLIMQYKLPEAIAARDALAKCLYGALFDWIVLQVNHALLNKDQAVPIRNSIGVLDIFGFEDFGLQNSFEQLCINYANEHLQYYFNLHVFKYEQKEYKREGIKWTDIEFMDNSGCLHLFESKPQGLLCILDDSCNFPGGSNENLLHKFNNIHKENPFYEKPQRKENAFIIKHYAGKVKYQVAEMREKNLDLMRQDIVSVLKNSSMAFVRELVGADPVAVFRWAILRAFFRGYFAFRSAGIKHRKERADQSLSKIATKTRFRTGNESLVRKNKSFRPRERPKKGLKNLQSVKTLTAGQNLINNQTSVKTRKQPLTVTAQFQNSLIALMETLNQANPFFIRCIKSNPNKIPNQFDDATVTRQLRYTGMLETVRIRRAGYNVRLTYEEFIQHYRILLPKGLLSSQKDVRDFMNRLVDLNKQHYQLGITKIYMRESQKMRLDIKLHTKIIESIVSIQRWFRSYLQRQKFLHQRQAAIVIQSNWRMYLAQKQFHFRRACFHGAAITIQAAWRMHVARKKYVQVRKSVIVIQAHLRGKLSRKQTQNMRQKHMRERQKLRSTQSLPVNERSIDVHFEHVKRIRTPTPHYSLDADIELCMELEESPSHRISKQKRDQMLDQTEQQIRDLLITKDEQYLRKSSITNVSAIDHNPYLSYQPPPSQTSSSAASSNYRHDDVLDLGSKTYDIEKAIRRNTNDEPTETLKRFDFTKTPIRRIDSGPTRRDNRFDVKNNIQTITAPPRPTPATDVEIVFVNPPVQQQQSLPLSSTTIQTSQSLRSSPYNVQQYSLETLPQRRDIVCRSLNEEYQNYQPPIVYHQQPQADNRVTIASVPPKGKAAALLGTTTTEQTSAVVVSPSSKHSKKEMTDILSKNKRTKNNMSEEISSGSYLVTKVQKFDGTLSRRNSDPANNKVPLLEVNRGNDLYQSSTNINIGGHRFRKVSRISKSERCASCDESDSFISEGHRCLDCKILVHTKCIQNGGIKSIKCGSAKRSTKRLKKISERDKINSGTTSTPNSKFSGTKEYTDSTDKIISDAKELQLMQDFITQKICQMEGKEGEKVSEVDRVFKKALREFKTNLVAQYSVANKHNSDSLNIKYRDLIANFEQVIETACGKTDDFPKTMGVNAFRGFMNEFMSSREAEKPKMKRKKEKKRKADEQITYSGHTFQLTILNIATVCEICQQFLLWPIERGLVCQNCRLTVHKKCYVKSVACSNPTTTLADTESVESGKLFKIQLTQLCCSEGSGTKIPNRIDQLITKIEMHGLYAEGLYRKSGVSSKIKELQRKMNEPANEEIDYEHYNVHVLTNVLKTFLRDLPEPLLTFDRYDDFLRAADLSEDTDRVQTLLSLIKKLPPAHHALLERLVFHLARVAQREEHNRMSASSLAIVFAPCVLRTNRPLPAQDSLNDISRQTKCMETIITQKMLNIKTTLADIDTLDTAAHTATTRLSTLRSSKVFTQEEFTSTSRAGRESAEAEEMLLEGHIQEIRKEKALLTSTLPSLARATSDDDLLSTDLDGEGGSLDDLSSKDKDVDSHKMNRDSRDVSVDSALSSSAGDGGLSSPSATNQRFSTQSSAAEDEMAVKYNLREQYIDYIPTASRKQQQQQGGSSQQKILSPQRSIVTCTISPASMKNGSELRESSGRELQRQKPIVMRSISGGAYESSKNCTTTGLQRAATTMATMDTSSLNNNNNNDEDEQRKSKSQSMEDEPIMV
ncbi:unconventional myosin-IXb-like isoform X3 [Chironomus tepperi]|uniref:unconventional myosin-IXb-like isoform X3 n=1 Tax=Chironomus tepperi TaxID=113505 RepID=UPI00391F712C